MPLKKYKSISDLKLLNESVLEGSLAGFWDWNILKNEEYLSPRFKEMFGYDDHEMENKPESWQKIAFQEDLPEMFENFNKHVSSAGKIPFKSIVRYHHKNGKTVWVRCNGKVIEWGENGEPIRAVGCHIDITEEKELELKLKNALTEREVLLKKEKELGLLKSSFVSMASHQFRTPLAVIQSNAQLFEMLVGSDQEVKAEKYQKISTRITEEISKMTALMDDVLILGKLTSENVHYDPQECDLFEFCNVLIDQFNLIQEDGRKLDFVVKGKPYNVEIDHKLLTHSLSNIISNAFKYSVGKANPSLKLTYEEKEFSLTVSDKGIGIPKENMEDLLLPFFRGNNSVGIKGTGLGLSIAKEYLDINKGILIINSTEGVGSSFEMKFQK